MWAEKGVFKAGTEICEKAGLRFECGKGGVVKVVWEEKGEKLPGLGPCVKAPVVW